MTAGTYDIIVEQGATFTLAMTWKDSAGSAVNLTGYTARMQVRPAADSTGTLLTLTTENGRIALGGAAGTITLTVAASDTAALTAGTGVYDIELVSGGGVVTRLLQGSVTISREVTR